MQYFLEVSAYAIGHHDCQGDWAVHERRLQIISVYAEQHVRQRPLSAMAS